MSMDIEQEYNSRISMWKMLIEEVRYTLEDAIGLRSLKIHSLESRVKDIASLVGKAASKSYEDPIREIEDIVGVRVVTLFRSAMSSIDSIIYEEFKVLSKDDKSDDEDSVLGYQSVHYICTIKPEYNGPKYKIMAGEKFEIQVRSLCMHAWAAASHYLDYKGDWDVPKELKASLKALSGLFHIADSQLEQFFEARNDYHEKLSQGKAQKSNQEINLETLSNYLGNKFPERRYADKSEISPLVQELMGLGVSTISSVNDIIDQVGELLAEVESTRNMKFGVVGAVRVSLGLTSQQYRDLKYDGRSLEDAMLLFSTE